MRRQVNLASATLLADLSAIKFLYTWAESQRISLEGRFHQGELLTLEELTNLTESSKYHFKCVLQEVPHPKPRNKASQIISLEKLRMSKSKKLEVAVNPATTARRLYVICDYLKWLVQKRTTWLSTRSAEYHSISSAQDRMIENIKVRIPQMNRNMIARREGLSKEAQQLLLEIVEPTSPRNPWKNSFTRLRNELIIHLLLNLGTRRGELLIIRIQRDLNISANTLVIPRAPDDKNDPRRDEPNAKTLPRELPLEESLSRMLIDYITKVRNSVKGARSHDYLLVAAKTGRPMSKAALTKIFDVLRETIPELPRELSAHVLRHTWNDNFSEQCDVLGIPEEIEKQTRNYLMGWNKLSRTAEIYTYRFVKRKASEVSLKMQERLVKGKS